MSIIELVANSVSEATKTGVSAFGDYYGLPKVDWDFGMKDVPYDMSSYPWERGFNWKDEAARHMFDDWHNFLVWAALLYCPLVFIGRMVMRHSDPFDLSWPLALWNFLLASFSAVGFYNLAPLLYTELHRSGLEGQLLDYGCYTNAAVAWIFYFNISKVFEWVDTVFIVLRKKPLRFLHWFHHICTMIACWQGTLWGANVDCLGLWFATMNLFVHAVMYSYYGLMAIPRSKTSPGGFNHKVYVAKTGPFITIVQVTQMAVAVWVQIVNFRINERAWQHNWFGQLGFMAMYAVYLMLFVELFCTRFICGGGKKKNRASDGEAKKEK